MVDPFRVVPEGWMDAHFHGLKPVATHSEPLRGTGRPAPRIGLPIVGRFPRCSAKRYGTCSGPLPGNAIRPLYAHTGYRFHPGHGTPCPYRIRGNSPSPCPLPLGERVQQPHGNGFHPPSLDGRGLGGIFHCGSLHPALSAGFTSSRQF